MVMEKENAPVSWLKFSSTV